MCPGSHQVPTKESSGVLVFKNSQALSQFMFISGPRFCPTCEPKLIAIIAIKIPKPRTKDFKSLSFLEYSIKYPKPTPIKIINMADVNSVNLTPLKVV